MEKGHFSRYARSLTLATVFLSSAVAAHAQTSDTFLKGFEFSGHLDLFYQYDFNKPATGDYTTHAFNSNYGINFRQFDTVHNSFTLAALQLNAVRKPTAENPWGLTVQFSGGKVADILSLTEPAGNNSASKYLQQAYVTYAAKNGLNVDFGKFLTWIGYEGIVTPDQDEYSRSFLFFFCQPIYHTGLRVTSPLGNTGVTGGAYLVNGWNEFEDSNASKSYGASLSKTFGKTSVSANYYGGNEGSTGVNGFVSAGTTNVQLGDLVVTHQLTDKIKLALNADYGDARPSDAAASQGKFRGIAGYVLDQFTPKFSVGLRYESVTDPDGIRSGILPGAGGAQFNSITGAFNYAITGESLLRIEVRYDSSNRNAFNSSSGAGALLNGDSNRTTVLIAHTLRF